VCVCVCVRACVCVYVYVYIYIYIYIYIYASSFDLIRSHSVYVFHIIPKNNVPVLPQYNIILLTSVNENMFTESKWLNFVNYFPERRA